MGSLNSVVIAVAVAGWCLQSRGSDSKVTSKSTETG